MKNALFAALLLLPAQYSSAAENSVLIPEDVPYYDKTVIQDNVVHECTKLGTGLSSYVATALTKESIDVTRSAELDLTKGTVLDIQILNLSSSGNAFSGHHKNMTLRVKLYKDNQMVDEHSFTRNSKGGVFGGFKGSCNVLDRVTETLGSDVARWYKTKL